MVSKLDVSPSATHVAAVSYSTDPVVVLRFNGFQQTDQVNQLLDRMPWQRGYTYTDKALLLADGKLFQTSTGMRLSVPKVRDSNDNGMAAILVEGTRNLLFISCNMAAMTSLENQE